MIVELKGDNMSSIGQELKETRHRLGWSRQRLAELLRVSIGSIVQWEKAIREPRGLYRTVVEKFIAENRKLS